MMPDSITTPIDSEHARFILETDGDTLSLSFDNGSDSEWLELALQAPDCFREDFIWLAKSVANFHDIPLEDET